jgi:SAM-dependent methyltransferase
MQTVSDLVAAAKVWNDPNEPLENVSRRIHDGVPLELLAARGQSYADQIFDLFPYRRPTDDASIMEIGSGVGYIMEAMGNGCRARGITPGQIIGLDIAEHMIARASARLHGNPIFSFVHYDGFQVPLPDHSLDLIYSVASLQHVPRPYVFNLFFEILRLLKHDGYAVIHLMGVKHLRHHTETRSTWLDEVQRQICQTVAHWMHYYSAEELQAVFCATGFGHFDVRDGDSIWSLVQPADLSLPIDFDRAAYLAMNADLADARADPEVHWLEYGHREGRPWK